MESSSFLITEHKKVFKSCCQLSNKKTVSENEKYQAEEKKLKWTVSAVSLCLKHLRDKLFGFCNNSYIAVFSQLPPTAHSSSLSSPTFHLV